MTCFAGPWQPPGWACWGYQSGRCPRSRRARPWCRSPTRRRHFRLRAVNRQYDVRTIEGAFTPADRFFTTQHYGHPVVEPATFRLKVTGLVNRPLSLSLDELRAARQHGPRRRIRMLGQPPPVARSVRQRPMDGRAAESGARSRRPQTAGARARVLRRRSRPGRDRVPNAEVLASNSSTAGA